MPEFKKLLESKLKGPGIKDGPENGEVAEYSLSAYLYL
jgi:hypothetical protein